MTKLCFIASLVGNMAISHACEWDLSSAADAGVGAPGVVCGSSRCDGITQDCCLNSYAGTNTCMDVNLWCATPTSTGVPATCDEQSDCPSGESCCVYYGAGYGSVQCLPNSECPGKAPYVTKNLLCESPAEHSDCPNGKACVQLSAPFPAGWSRCEL
jgi:hypothetical protein